MTDLELAPGRHVPVTFHQRCGDHHLAVLDTVNMCEREGPGLLVTRISVPRPFRRQGIGRELLTRLCSWADDRQVIMYLFVASSGGMSDDDLQIWYRRFGFDGGRYDLMCRLPRTASSVGSSLSTPARVL